MVIIDVNYNLKVILHDIKRGGDMRDGREIDLLAEYTENNLVYLYNEDDREAAQGIGSEFHKLIQISDLASTVSGLPDMLLKLPNKTILFEQFRFDASDKIEQNGSENKKKESDRNIVWKEEMRKLSPETPEIFTSTIVGCNYSLMNYLENLSRNYVIHYNKVERYKEAVKEAGIVSEDEIIEIAFVIIDETILGSHYYDDNGKIKPLTIFRTREFYDLLTNSPKLNYVFNGVCNSEKNGLFFSTNTSKSREYILEHLIDFTKNNFMTYNPTEGRIGAFIPNE